MILSITKSTAKAIDDLSAELLTDFMHDQLVDHRKYRLFNVIDDFKREGLAIEAGFSFPSTRVIRVLDQLLEWRSKPKVIRCDNGPEFISHQFINWAKNKGIIIKNTITIQNNRTYMKLSEKIKLLRTSNEMTQPELAGKTGIEQSYLSKLENDKGSPSFDIISKIAQAFDMTGMELINSLSKTYIEKNLSHIPEVAAEYASIKKQQIKKFKRGYILGTLFIAFGSGLFFYGIKSTWKIHSNSLYQSQGVIKSGETPYQFQKHPIKEIAETNEEHKIRLKANRNRIAIKQITSEQYRGEFFITQVEGGRRMYAFDDFTGINKAKYNLISTLGVILIVVGTFTFLFNSKFKFTSIE